MTPFTCIFENNCKCYPQLTTFSEHGGHFGRHLGFREKLQGDFRAVLVLVGRPCNCIVFLRDLISGVRNRIHDNLPNIIKDAFTLCSPHDYVPKCMKIN